MRFGIKTQLVEMVPRDISQIKEYFDIIEDYSSDAAVMITLESSEKNVRLMQEAAQEIAAKLENIVLIRPSKDAKLNPWQRYAIFKKELPKGVEYDTLNLVRRIDYKHDEEFLSRYGLLIKDPAELERTAAVLGSPQISQILANINFEFEKVLAQSVRAVSHYERSELNREINRIQMFLESIEKFIANGDSAGAAQQVSDFLKGSQYYMSSDNTVLLMMLQPAVSFDKFDEMMYLGYRIDDTLRVMRERYSELTIGRSGTIMLQVDSVNGAAMNFGWSSLIDFAIIFIILIGSFKEWKNPLFLFVALLTGIIWTTGILGLLFGEINILSAAFCIVLIGLGIDYGIHFISGFSDGRYVDKSVNSSISYMYSRVGSGVIIGALTTAAVFFCLSLTGFQAYLQMGIVIGISVLVMLVTQLVVLPALISFDNKSYSVIAPVLYKYKLGFVLKIYNLIETLISKVFRVGFLLKLIRREEFWFLSHLGQQISRMPVAITVIALTGVLVALCASRAIEMQWEYDFLAIQPKNALSTVTQNTILEKFEMFPSFVMVEARSVEECRELSGKYREAGQQTGLIGRVDAITEFLPTEEAWYKNSAVLKTLRKELSDSSSVNKVNTDKVADELHKLRQNVADLGNAFTISDNPDEIMLVKQDFTPVNTDTDKMIARLAAKVRTASHNDSVSLNNFQEIVYNTLKSTLDKTSNAPVLTLENLPDEIRSRYVNSNNNNLLINVYPRGYVWNEKSLRAFTSEVEKVSERTTGFLFVVQFLIGLMIEKGWIAIIMGAIATILILLIELRSPGHTALAILSLIIGLVWMLGIMEVLGMKFSIMTFMALPLIIGIGLDHGIHVADRYKIEGRGSVPFVLKSTGRAVLLTSIVTMMGFGSLGLGEHVGLADFGKTIFFGIGACFVSSTFVLPAVITVWEFFSGNPRSRV